MKAVIFYLVLSVAAAPQELHGRDNWTVGQTVQTSSGPVNGHAAYNNTGVSEYLGIPYAIPPVGDLRWTAPQKYDGTSTIEGAHFGYSCLADLTTYNSKIISTIVNLTTPGILIVQNLAQTGDLFSEDCLTINVWTKPQAGEAKKAVLVWIYGGAFTTGNSDSPGYNGQFLADEEDVIVVSFNYRLNIFGFPGSPETTQNLGLLDQRLAVEWVRDNIAAFGGDPTRITLFGQSAGGASVDYYTFAWTEDPIVNAFIPQSGTVIAEMSGLGHTTAEESASSWYNVTSKLGCGGSTDDPSSVLACMRGKSSISLITALTDTSTTFGPTADEQVVFSNYTDRAQAGKFIKRPILLGNTDYEAGLFVTLTALGGTIVPDAFWTNLNQDTFTCPAAARANISVSYGIPTWRYRWFGRFPNTRLTSIPDSGAWHGSELPILFDVVPRGIGIPENTREEIAIGKYLRGAWTTFAKDPVNGLTNYEGGWPSYASEEQTLIQLAYQNKTGRNLAWGSTYDEGCPSLFTVDKSLGGSASNTTPSATSSVTTSVTTSVEISAAVPTETVSGAPKETAGYFLAFVLLGVAFYV